MLPLQSFRAFFSRHQLFEPDQKILLAVSGGKDSVLMVHLFKQAGLHFGIAHCNFQLRAEESMRDEAFVKMLAATLDVPFHVTHFNTKAYVKAHRCSTQMAARDLRYAWFEEIRAAEGYEAIALAHHQNDAIETMLINLSRGTGISGLHGIAPKRERLIRPLLFLSREDIETLIEKENIDYVEDSSNLSDHYARNKIRLHVIPQLKAINPGLEQTFAQNIQRFQEAEMIIQQTVLSLRSKLLEETQTCVSIQIDAIRTLQPQKLLCYELLKPYNFNESLTLEVLAALDKQTGTSFYSSTHRITLDRHRLIITPLAAKPSGAEWEQGPGINQIIHPASRQIDLPDHVLNIRYAEGNSYNIDGNAYVDHELLIYPLILRTRQPGDVFVPLGMKTHKKLSDFFIDEKVPLPEKDKIPLLINGNGDIIWVAGMRQDNRYKVTATTKKVAIFELKLK
ncbi:tRNA lysidine(34) synthetase TilS [Pedobacter sp. SAFR-022]|uniref:tRNA lysidine(34) synthetase TilS n=1 Tax=Pedobacter sp. SAFR-022 TaxID=3436861 RepID=UPI003F7E46D5